MKYSKMKSLFQLYQYMYVYAPHNGANQKRRKEGTNKREDEEERSGKLEAEEAKRKKSRSRKIVKICGVGALERM